MRRVLLYEPFAHGHHRVLLKYYCGALVKAGFEPVVCDSLLPEHHTPFLPDALDQLGRKERCEGVHLLTFERLGPQWLRHRKPVWRGLPMVATYYLYDNLYAPLRGLMWDVLFGRGLLKGVLISDDFLSERRIPAWRRRRLWYVPDPWDNAEFSAIPRTTARQRLDLPSDRAVILLFGALRPRKGIELLLDAMRLVPDNTPYLVLLAGQLDPCWREGKVAEVIAGLRARGVLRIDDRFVPESEVSVYFHAADYVVCPYPSTFTASSNVFTRACAAGVPAIVPRHGVVGEIARRAGAGLLFDSDSAPDLARCLRQAINHEVDVDAMRANAKRSAASKELANFEEAVMGVYQNWFPQHDR